MVARLFCYTKPKKMKKIITTTVCLLATIGMAAQGEQHVFSGDHIYYRATHPEFSVDGMPQLYFEEEGTNGITFTFYDDNFVEQRQWTAQDATIGKRYEQEFIPEVTGVEYNNGEITPILSGNYIPGEKEEVFYTSGSSRPYSLNFNDFDSPFGNEREFTITQTLFNDDDKYEYLRPVYSDGLSQISMSYCRVSIDDMTFSLPCIVKDYGTRPSGFQVVSEDGSVLQTVNFDGSFVGGQYDPNLIRIHGKLYLAFSGDVLDEANNTMSQATLFYALDRKSNQIQKVGEHIGNVNVYPRVADRSDQITVELNDNGDIREIQVVNANGQTEVRIPVKEGQKSITIPANQLGRGMNVVNAVGRKGHQSHKVVVR